MVLRKKSFVVACLVLPLILGVYANLCRAQSSSAHKFESERVSWRSLHFKEDRFIGKVEIRAQLAVLPAKAAVEQLLAVPQAEALQPSGATIVSITVESGIHPLFGSNEILKTHSWFNPHDAAALQRVRLRHGDKIWQKSYRFQPHGVYHQRKQPADKKQLESAPEQWTTFEKRFYQYNGEDHKCAAVLEPSALLYLASVMDFSEQRVPLNLCVFDKQQLHRVTVTAGGARQLKVNYLERSPRKQIRRKGTIDAIKISFQPRSLAPPNAVQEEFSFLGLKGDFDIYIDQASGIPVQVSGKISTFGDVDIRLQQVSF
ncbi:MAG: hypothetical protein JSW26_17030 [Desulfobacterales bacterium]|nr:MAG: hypothetical protein JSW26_17030 [Desulfobacterales bacterium]